MSKAKAIETLTRCSTRLDELYHKKPDGSQKDLLEVTVKTINKAIKELEEEEVTDANGVSSVVFSLVKRIDDLEEWQRSIGRWCKTCDGKGFIVSNDSSSVIYTTCSVCKGMGKI